MDISKSTVERIASELEALAARLRLYAPGLTSGDTNCVTQASEIVNEYVQGVGRIGGRLSDVIRNAGYSEADKIRGAR